MNDEKFMKEISNYNYHGEVFTYSTLFSYMSNESVINRSGVGSGKSRGSTELLEMLNLENVLIKTGYLTPKGFFNTVKENGDKLLVFDEADSLLSTRKTTRLMKSLLTKGEAVWETDHDEDQWATLNGCMILNCNDYTFNKGIEDKLITNQTSLSTSEFKGKIKQARGYSVNRTFFQKLRNKLEKNRKNLTTLNEKEKDRIYKFIFDLPVISSFRTKTRVFLVFRNMKTLFGGLDNPMVWSKSQYLAKNMLPEDPILRIAGNVQSKTKKKKVAEKIANAIGRSKRTGYRKINKLIENNYLKEVDNDHITAPD